MELWIRSQDKTILMNISNLIIKQANGYYYIETKTGKNIFELGQYNSKWRALEILDEIDEFIDLFQRNGFGNVLSDDGVHPKHTIYKMPEK